ncbi:MAG: hypothetical protein HY089_10600 [Ignavibacteriales bacterium]|nr:hypothetical protein [Ignavibacteriales bacterium]
MKNKRKPAGEKRPVRALKNSWPPDYFELFGALAKERNFKRPEQYKFAQDIRRQNL